MQVMNYLLLEACECRRVAGHDWTSGETDDLLKVGVIDIEDPIILLDYIC